MKAYLNISQVRASLASLRNLNPFFGISFLAFKDAGIPVGTDLPVVFSQIAQRILDRHYKPVPAYAGYYSPFRTSDQSKRWLAPRYGSTSLQRITTDTFGDALIHTRNIARWGWRSDYVERLQGHLASRRIPAFDMGVWLFRGREWPSGVTPDEIVRTLVSEYRLSTAEIEGLFDREAATSVPLWTSDQPISERDLLEVIGSPPGWAPPAGAALRYLDITEVGPAKHLHYEPAERLNIITGNNSLGKTFLLECLWWALTGDWLEYAAMPRSGVPKGRPRIAFSLTSPSGRPQESSSSYNWDRQAWVVSPPTRRLPGLVIYARFDGSFAIWDPARSQMTGPRGKDSVPGQIFLSRKAVWDGTAEGTAQGKERWICNGLLRDWFAWQTGGEAYAPHYTAFLSSLKELSPSESETLSPGEPIRLPLDSRPIPTLRMPYGDVPILHASAAVQRIVALAYALVWAWQEHLVNSSLVRREPQRHLVLVVDEVEAHLHPLWQRLIVPSMMRVVAGLSAAVNTQLHIATHSPLVLASAETVFDESRDSLHHLRLAEPGVILEVLPFVKRGRADLWLMSDVFGLGHARSLCGERAIEKAKGLQLEPHPSAEAVSAMDSELAKLLPDDDDFWPRWRYFAEVKGLLRK